MGDNIMPVTINGTSGLVTATSYAGAGGDLTGITTGKILQFQSVKYDTYLSTTSSSYIDSGLTCNITPTSASSKIVIAGRTCPPDPPVEINTFLFIC